MHPTAMSNCRRFFEVYGDSFAKDRAVKVIEIGSQDVNGSLREVCPTRFDYVGVDFVAGKGVDVILEDPYVLPFEDETADVVLSSSCFEHSEMFWIAFLEILRILKPDGLLYLNVPSNGNFHRYPVDCWRFYPDSGRALVAWARRSGLDSALLESYTSDQAKGGWNDFVGVFLKDARHAETFGRRIIDTTNKFSNGLVYGTDVFRNPQELPEDKRRLRSIPRLVRQLFGV